MYTDTLFHSLIYTVLLPVIAMIAITFSIKAAKKLNKHVSSHSYTSSKKIIL